MARPDEPDVAGRPRLYRYGALIARRRLAVVGVWVMLVVLCVASLPALQRALGATDYTVKGSDSARVERLIERLFPDLGSENDVVVLHSTRHLAGDRTYRAVIAAVDSAVRAQRDVRTVTGPYDANATGQILAGEHTALTLIALGGSSEERFNNTRAIQAAVTRAAGDSGIQAWLTGSTPLLRDFSEMQRTDTAGAELIGLPVAFVVLLLALGALVAAMLPLLLAFAGLLLAFGALALLSLVFRPDSLLLGVVTMIGLGIGIDYSLFIVSRFREELARSSWQERDRSSSQGRDPSNSHELARSNSQGRDESERVADAIGLTLLTSGRTVLFSGVIVTLSLASLLVTNSGDLREIAVGTMVVVVCMVATVMTLLPAVLALLGDRVNRGALPWRERGVGWRARGVSAQPVASNPRRGAWGRWALLIMRRPILIASTTTVLLLVAAIPVLHLNYGFTLGVVQDTGTDSGRGERLLAQALSPGAAGPIKVIVTSRGGSGDARASVAVATRLDQELEGDRRVTGVVERQAKSAVLLAVVPSVAVNSPVAIALVRHIRDDLSPPLEAHGHVVVLVGGPTAQEVDTYAEFEAKLPLVMALILGTALLFLLVVLRSVVLPVKAVLMNLLATAATMGLVVWVFQYGHGQQLLNFTSTGAIQPTTPLIMFALLFGLSMDYEIFLIRRIQEEWKKTGDNRMAIATGIERTAMPITAAAAIMVAVFGSFVTTDLLEFKQLGFALAVAIALDATLIRFVLVPATMRLLGPWNWWLPDRLARVLPDINNE